MTLASCIAKATALRPETRAQIEARTTALRRDEGLDEATAAERAVREALDTAEGGLRDVGDAGYLDTLVKREAEARFDYVPPAENPAFKRWFGDSKVVDAEGKPLVVYHGTKTGGFTEFKPNSRRGEQLGFGVHFAEDKALADRYATDPDLARKGKTPDTYAVFLSIKNPLFADSVAVEGSKEFALAQALAGSKMFTVKDENGHRTAYVQHAIDAASPARAERLVREAGYDGIRYLASVGTRGVGARTTAKSVSWVVFSPTQIKSATGNNGSYDPDNADIRFQLQPKAFELPAFKHFARGVQTFQDQYVRWKQAVDAVREQNGVVNEANDFYRAEERSYGRIAAELEDMQAGVQAYLKEIAKDGLTLKGVEEYAYARYAKIRNDKIAAKRPGMPDGGSGMTNAEAAQILKEGAADPVREAKLLKHADTLRGLARANLDRMLAGGLIDQKTHDAWAADTLYIPLKGKAGVDNGIKGVGGGFDVRGKESQEAKGRHSRAENILAQIIQDSTRVVIRSNKNEIVRTFGQFVLDNPDPNLWLVEAVESKPVITTDDNGDRIIEEEDKPVHDSGKTVAYKDGGRTVHVQIKDQALLAEFKNLNYQQLNTIIAANLWVNRFLARSYTSLNPVFPLKNFLRDIQGATLGAVADFGREGGSGLLGAARLVTNLPRAFAEAAHAEMGGKPSALYNEFRYSGAKAGFYDLKSVDDLAQAVQNQVTQAGRSWYDPRQFPKKAIGSIVGLLEGVNSTFENATRFAYYKVARSAGMSVAKSASLTKNSTVNFNRKGTAAPQMGMIMLFFNPAIQGMVRTGEILTSPKAASLVASAMAGAFFLALRNADMGDDDDGVAWWDKIPSDVKERNLVIVLPPESTAGDAIPGSKTGRYVKIPLHYGLNFFVVMANAAADMQRNGADAARGMTRQKAGLTVSLAFLRSWVPYDGLASAGEDSKNTPLAVMSPGLAILMRPFMNVGPFGRPLYPDDQRNRNLPDSQKYFPSQAGTIFQKTTSALNEITGGSAYTPGTVDISPGSLEFMTRAITGGMGNFVLDVTNTFYARQSIERTDADIRRTPLVKDFYGTLNNENDGALAYKRMDDAAKVIEPIKKALSDGNYEEARALRDKKPEVYAAADMLDSVRDQLATLKKRDLQIIASKEPDAVKYARLQATAAQRREVLQKWNRVYDRVLRASQR